MIDLDPIIKMLIEERDRIERLIESLEPAKRPGIKAVPPVKGPGKKTGDKNTGFTAKA